jgi:very-short-patch-repair endonuclease
MSMDDETIEDGAFFRQRAEIAARMARFTESPIEIMFGMAMMELMDDGWELMPQFKWRRYRIDWALQVPGKPLIFIECDGNEFHTKAEDVARDRRRDIMIRRAGIRLFRFTGSEIYQAAQRCALKVWWEARQ